MNKIKLTIGTQVQILDNSNWHGLFAIVDEIVNIDNNNNINNNINIPVLYCVSKPTEKYYVYHDLEDKIRIIEKDNNNTNNNYNIENADTTCPICKNDNKRYWLAFFYDKTYLVCRDCWYSELI